MTALGDFLYEAASRRREPGQWDCGGFPAAWAMACGYPDPMGELRGAYGDEQETRAVVEDAGGLVPLFTRLLGAAGVPMVDGEPQAGDIGVLQAYGFESGAIYTGERWALVGDKGVAFVKRTVEHVAAIWRP